jgi:hypothetical protein
MSKIGDIVIDKAEIVRALWRPLDAEDVLLASMCRSVYETHPIVRELFANLATTIAANLNRSAGETITVQSMLPVQSTEAKIDRQNFPCWNCSSPQAADARAFLRTFSDGDLTVSLSPHGTPSFCCKVTPAAWLAT